jgi:hypothetical protein
MATTFDARRKDMGREGPRGYLTIFDQPLNLRMRLLNVDLSTETAA